MAKAASAALLLLALVCAATSASAQLQYWRAYAKPGSVANTTTKARVTLWLTYNATQGNGTWAGILKVEKISNFTMAHVHLNTTQYPGIPALWLWPAGAASGPLKQPVSGNEFSVRFAVDSSLLNGVNGATFLSLLQTPGATYLNAHTTKYPAGEVQGLVKSSSAF